MVARKDESRSEEAVIFSRNIHERYSRENACGQKYECSFKNISTHGVFSVSQPIF